MMTNLRAILAALILGSLALPATLRAQTDPMAKWKPNVGDKFICAISHSSSCGDYKCDGLDTVMFEIIDTSYNSDNQHQDAVFAATTVLAPHYTFYSWGFGWGSTPVVHPYSDTTLMALMQPHLLETSFQGYTDGYHKWSRFLFDRDSSLMFDGQSYTAAYESASGTLFLPTIGWFFSLSGYGGVCTGYCTFETWTMSLIAAIKTNMGIPLHSVSNMQLYSNGGLLVLTDAVASAISLSDALGRPIHSWQLPVDPGPREITLNVADVPSGIYFLKLTAPDVEEVRRVCIAH